METGGYHTETKNGIMIDSLWKYLLLEEVENQKKTKNYKKKNKTKF